MEIWTYDPEKEVLEKEQYKSFEEMCTGKPFAEQILDLGVTLYAESEEKMRWLAFEPAEEQEFEKISKGFVGDPTIMLSKIMDPAVLFKNKYRCAPFGTYIKEEDIRSGKKGGAIRLAIQYDAISGVLCPN